MIDGRSTGKLTKTAYLHENVFLDFAQLRFKIILVLYLGNIHKWRHAIMGEQYCDVRYKGVIKIAF